MTRFVFALVLIASCAGPAWASGQIDTPAGADAERSRIAAERAAANTLYERDAVACHARFAVNDCLNEARARRREALADLRRQEISLNDAQRRRKGAAQQQRIDEKATQLSQRQVSDARSQSQKSREARELRALKKVDRHAGPPPADAVAPDDGVRQAEQEAARQQRAADAKAQARKQQDHVREALARKERVLKRQREEKKPLARPLPVPP
ncbi:MAG: hypothetical protein AB7I35_02070 [Ramlibacter sp.]